MPTDEKTAPAVILPQTLTRNEVEFPLTLSTFGKLSPNAGQQYPHPDIKPTNVEHFVPFAGIDWVAKLLLRDVKREFADIWLDNIDEATGTINLDAWKAAALDFTEGVATLKDLQDEKNELSDRVQQITDMDEYVAPEGQEPTPAFLALQDEIKGIGNRIKSLNAQMKQIKAKYEAVVAKREAAKAAKAASAVAA